MKKLLKLINLFVFLILLMTARSVLVAAETGTGQTEAVAFHYQNILPDNQLTKGDYFDLLVKPGQRQTLETEVVNDSDEELTVLVSINNATTNGLGVIEYGSNNLAHTIDFTYQLTKMLTGPQEITLEPHQSKKIEYQLQVPQENIPGMVLGGIELQEKKTTSTASEGVAVRSEFVYTFSVSLQMSEDKLKPEFSFNPVEYVEKDSQQLIILSLNNDQPMLVKGLQVESIVMSQNSKKVLSEHQLKEVKMAPLSIMNIPIELSQYSPGDYRVRTTVKYEEQEWEWEQAFKIEQSQEQIDVSDTYAEPITENKNYGKWLLICGLFLVAVFMVYLLIRR